MTRDNITSNVRPIDPERLRRIFGEPVDYPIRFTPPTLGERLVEFMRRWQFRIGIACYLIAVFAACVFAFQLGRGL